ncbi:MAG: 2-amino-4-hydroxy-6-hydroxymethyldihydropteridine diphosphokinase [Verrucomicrobiae bacterium]|nr:2-amino-4-hydroxy-6-hydroxymethyldihydropteridine diphosphokinase [Verrucomicrobiae bacterium]
MVEVGIGLGSNLGDRWEHLTEALHFLKNLSVNHFLEVSPFYETSPVHCTTGAPLFLNAVAIIQSREAPEELLEKLRGFERARGRAEVYEKNSSRPLDLDILFWGDRMVKSEKLMIPHPRLLQRRFVLQPLCDLRPNLILPGETQPLHYFLSHLTSQEEVTRVKNNS